MSNNAAAKLKTFLASQTRNKIRAMSDDELVALFKQATAEGACLRNFHKTIGTSRDFIDQLLVDRPAFAQAWEEHRATLIGHTFHGPVSSWQGRRTPCEYTVKVPYKGFVEVKVIAYTSIQARHSAMRVTQDLLPEKYSVYKHDSEILSRKQSNGKVLDEKENERNVRKEIEQVEGFLVVLDESSHFDKKLGEVIQSKIKKAIKEHEADGRERKFEKDVKEVQQTIARAFSYPVGALQCESPKSGASEKIELVENLSIGSRVCNSQGRSAVVQSGLVKYGRCEVCKEHGLVNIELKTCYKCGPVKGSV